ncbi:MAG: response regulator [Paludibacter sp.]|nr:response regulator [Paludibacter sp.]
MDKVDIFLVEDNEDFSYLIEKAIDHIDKELSLKIVDNGLTALEVLMHYEQEGTRPRIILLDLNLPGLSGLDLLREIKGIEYLKQVPIILFTTSDNPKDVRAATEYGANAYVTKPHGYVALIDCLRSLFNFWFTHHTTIK